MNTPTAKPVPAIDAKAAAAASGGSEAPVTSVMPRRQNPGAAPMW